MEQVSTKKNRLAWQVAMLKLASCLSKELPISTLELIYRGHRSRFVGRHLEVVPDHRPAQRDREIVVAHEAGHILIAAVWGGNCTLARLIVSGRGEWVPFVDNHMPGVSGDFRPDYEPGRAFKVMVQSLAGIVAEHMIGRGHPATCFREAESKKGLAAEVASAAGIAPLFVYQAALVAAEGYIRQHIKAFNALCALFDEEDDVDPAAINLLMMRYGVCTQALGDGP